MSILKVPQLLSKVNICLNFEKKSNKQSIFVGVILNDTFNIHEADQSLEESKLKILFIHNMQNAAISVKK